ncbi:MAG: hypothetical protein ABIT16_08780 [Croceibacterium sp.]
MTGFSLSGDDVSLIYSWFAEDYGTSDLLCQAVERQKAKGKRSRNGFCLGLKLVPPDVFRMTVSLAGEVFVAFAAKLAFSRQMSAKGVVCGTALFAIPTL